MATKRAAVVGLECAQSLRSVQSSLRRTLHSTTFGRGNFPQYLRQRQHNLTKKNPSVRSASSQADSLGKTPLHDLHTKHGAKFVPFGDYSMPVQYSDLSIGDSHKWTREKASLFDVSHMVQNHLSGPGAAGLLSLITPSSVDTLAEHHSTLSCLLHPGTGGIVDDTVITRLGPDLFYFVTNAGCRAKDTEYLAKELETWRQAGKPEVKWTKLEGQGLVALQGPLSASIFESVLSAEDATLIKELYFGQSRYLKARLSSGKTSSDLLVSRGGYTGEDGFEISIPQSETEEFTQTLLEKAGKDKLRLAGLGARDSLRLEAGMCLYGHDLNDDTTPPEAALGWVVGKDRRSAGGFYGADTIIPQLSKGGTPPSKRRIGLVVEGAPAREGAEIVDAEGKKIGHITSGCPSPTLGKNIAMGYVDNGMHKSGTELQVLVRGKKRKATVSKMPFVPSKYWKAGQSPG